MLPSSSVPLERDAIGRYELLLELARGGMAVLHLARAQGVGGFSRLFAIKQILPHLAADPQFVDMFLNEGRIAARLSHPNLCPVFELFQERGELFLVMEYLDGVPWETLAAVAPRDPRGLQLTAGVLAQACEGLHHAHTFRDVDGTAMPIIHRDVSPQNLFVSVDGTCRVLDFGVSKVATDHRRTHTGLLKGKLPYMAPEQIRGEPLDARADIWAVGVMLWEALTGQRLFDRDTDFLTYLAIASADIPSVNAAASRYPPAIDRVIARALARDRDARYPSARDLAHDLQLATIPLGGLASRDHIAAAVAALCGPRIAARRRAIADAITQRASAQPDPATSPGPHAASHPAAATSHPRDTAPADAAETISMAMRRDAIVVAHRRRRTWLVALGAALTALTAVLLVTGAIRRSEPPASQPPAGPASTTASSPASGSPSRPDITGHAAATSASAPAPVPAPDTPASTTSRAPAGAPTAADGTATPGRTPSAVRTPARAPSGTRTAGTRAPSDAGPPGPSATSEIRTPGPRATSAVRTPTPTTSESRTPSPGSPSVDRPQSALAASGNTAPPESATSGDTASREPAMSGDTASREPATSGSRTAGTAVAGATPAMGWYAIDSNPYATIFIDGRKLGDTPLDRVPLSAGIHRVRAVLADGRERTFAIDITADRKTSSGTLTW
jgi:eukaryotic-like serine/threonine-protein kinase